MTCKHPSIHDDFIESLIDGKPYKLLRKHIGFHGYTPESYRAAFGVPPQLLGIVPANAGGFGDVTKATDAFFELEIEPLQSAFLELNDVLGAEALRFRERAKAPA